MTEDHIREDRAFPEVEHLWSTMKSKSSHIKAPRRSSMGSATTSSGNSNSNSNSKLKRTMAPPAGKKSRPSNTGGTGSSGNAIARGLATPSKKGGSVSAGVRNSRMQTSETASHIDALFTSLMQGQANPPAQKATPVKGITREEQRKRTEQAQAEYEQQQKHQAQVQKTLDVAMDQLANLLA